MYKKCLIIFSLIFIALIGNAFAAPQVTDSKKEEVDLATSEITDWYVKDGMLLCNCGLDYLEHRDSLMSKVAEYKNEEIAELKCDCGGNINISSRSLKWQWSGIRKPCAEHYYGIYAKFNQVSFTEYVCEKCRIFIEETKLNEEWRHMNNSNDD